ncbi:peptidoglycan -binding protein [Rhodovarius sp.]|uniref:peptidoglycan -binding protein n=1 Tax=Rhodovarius sp. TaxID=2972673 RepID=UPI0034A4AA60
MRRRGGSEGLNPWPGYVDALSTLLMVIIFVLLVFVLAQAFLSVSLSNSDRALERLNRQVIELSELLANERGQNQALRTQLNQGTERLREAVAARDALAATLQASRSEALRLNAERDTAQAEASRLAGRLSDVEAMSLGAERRLSGMENQLAEALARAEAATDDAASQLRRLADTNRARAAEGTARSAAEQAARAAAASLAELRATQLRAEAQGEAQANQLRELQAENQIMARRLAEAQTAGQTERQARDRAEREARGAAETARQELAALRRQLSEAATAQELAGRQLAAMRAEIAALNQNLQAERATITARVAELARLTEDTQRLTALREQLERDIMAERRQRSAAEAQAGEQTRLSEAASAQVALLTRQIEDLRRQLTRLANALDATDNRDRESEAQIAQLRLQLNAALAARVEELTRYRSDFFGRLREVLGNRPEVRIVGDRFVFQSEVLFPPASAELSPTGERQLRQLARVLVDIAIRIPPEIAWVMRVDGHADRTPIRSTRFATNWELSAARAIAVANLLIQEGLPANRVAAAAFGENQPLDTAETPEAYARNRRIELRLTDR